MNQRTVSGRLFDAANAIFLLLLMVVTLYPPLYVLFASLSGPSEIVAHKGLLLKPAGLTFIAYEKVLQNPMIFKGYLNTLIVVVGDLCINILLTSFGAYALSRRTLRYRKLITLIIVFTMFFDGD
ncbi:hypothetical protein LJK87_28280 [Paenibacillus sp. P25]|nr:hypothetical protein LJK87_28280 [Paenibacillus sp. P25]